MVESLIAQSLFSISPLSAEALMMMDQLQSGFKILLTVSHNDVGNNERSRKTKALHRRRMSRDSLALS